MFSKLKFIITNWGILNILISNTKKHEEAKERERCKHHLNLCLKHQQEKNHSHYSSDNCDHCELIKENLMLKTIPDRDFCGYFNKTENHCMDNRNINKPCTLENCPLEKSNG